MAPAAKYLLEVSVGVCVVYVLFALLFKGSTFFQLNRIYLIVGLLVSFFAPLINLPSNLIQDIPLAMSGAQNIETDYVPILFDLNASKGPVVSIAFILQVAYVLGVSFFLARLMFGIWNVMALKRKSVKVDVTGIVYIQESLPTFSFFNIIFARPDTNPMVIDHERIHIRQMHWLDVLVVEIASIVLWFNPILIWYKKAIKIQHEYLADQGVVDMHSNPETYMSCLVQTAYTTNGIPVTSQFASHSIKNRIIMLTKNKTPLYKTMLYFLIVPAVAILLLAFQETPAPVSTNATDAISAPQSTPSGAPVEASKVKTTVGFGERLHPATNKMVNHTGVDLVTDEGVDVMATADGVVIETTYNDMKGNFVVIRHSDQFVTQYYHLLKSTVTKGASVRKGDVIGLVGSTGVLSTNNHLHYEVVKDGKPVNPVEFLPKGYIY